MTDPDKADDFTADAGEFGMMADADYYDRISGAPGAERDRAALIDRIMDAELPRFAEALKRLGE
jgi:hypothetical protein